MKNREFRMLFVSLTALLLLVPKGAPAQELPKEVLAYPSMVVLNGKIATMDDQMRTVQAMAVRDGRILTLGTNDEIRKLIGPETEVIDAGGRTVLPGLVDVHTHPHWWLMNHFGYDPNFIVDPQLKLIIVSGKTAVEVHKGIEPAIQKRVAELGPGKWIFIKVPLEGLEEAYPRSSPVIDQGLVREEDLDRVAPNNPVVVTAGYFSTVTNTKAKEVMREKLGKELDQLMLWTHVIYDIILKDKTDLVKRLLDMELREFAAQGVTTVGTHMGPLEGLKALTEMDRDGKMPIRWGWSHMTGFTIGKDPIEFYRVLGNFLGQGSEYLWNIGVGNEGWDGERPPLRLAPRLDCTKAIPRSPQLREQMASQEPCGLHRPGTQRYNEHLAALKAGLRLVVVHSTMDGTTDIVFELLEQAMREGGLTLDQIRDRRLYFDHGTTIRPDQIPLWKKYGITMTFQSWHLRRGPEIERKYGVEYLKWLVPWKSMLDGGAQFVITTDQHTINVPQESKLFEWPWYGIWPALEAFITREVDGKAWVPEEGLDRIATLRGITTWASRMVLREKDLGSLEKGKLADFIVIDKDYFTIPEKEIHTLRTLLTVVGGKTIHRSSEF